MKKPTIGDDFRLSWSSLNTYHQCPLKFYHKYILREKEPSGVPLLFGSAFHVLLDTIYKEEKFYPAFAEEVWPEILKKERANKQYKHILGKDVKPLVSRGLREIKKFFTMASAEGLLKPAISSEQRVTANYRDHAMIGILDLCIETRHGITLIDWKTGKPDKKHIMQMILYAALLQKVLGIEVKAVAPCYTKFGTAPEYTIITKELRVETGRFLKMIYERLIQDDEYLSNKNRYCNWCGVQFENKCPDFYSSVYNELTG